MTKFIMQAQAISSVENLAVALGIPLSDIIEARDLSPELKYTQKNILKSNGETRVVFRPHLKLRKIQRAINKRIFKLDTVISWPHFLFGSIPNSKLNKEALSRDYISCATVHCGAKSILKIDIQDFFANVNEDIVYGIFKDFMHYSKEVSILLTEICTFEGSLPQGALTSSYLASLSLWDVEEKVYRRLSNKNLKYTRFVDDITVSSMNINTDFVYAMRLLENMLYDKDLPINKHKTEVSRVSIEPLLVHGLRIQFPTPRLPAGEVKRIRASVCSLERTSKEKNYRQTHSYRHDFNKCMGRVNKLARIGHIQHKQLHKKLKRILPLPSKKDVSRALSMVTRLEHQFEKGKVSYWYAKKFYIVHERVNVIQRSYPSIARIVRNRLRAIAPPKDIY